MKTQCLANPWRESEDRADAVTRKPRLQMDVERMGCGEGEGGMIEANHRQQIHNYELSDVSRDFPSTKVMAAQWVSNTMWRISKQPPHTER